MTATRHHRPELKAKVRNFFVALINVFRTTTIKITVGPSSFERVAMRCFEGGEVHYVILGEDHDDHDVWVLTADSIELIGTLKRPSLKRLHETMLMKRVKLAAKDFEFLREPFKQLDVEIRRVSMRLIEGSYTYVEYCPRCEKWLSDPIELCDCEHIKRIARPEEVQRILKLPWPPESPPGRSRR